MIKHLLCVYVYFHSAANQQWVFNQDTGIPGVFTITSKTKPTLFLTSPPNPVNGSKLYLSTEITGSGQDGMYLLLLINVVSFLQFFKFRWISWYHNQSIHCICGYVGDPSTHSLRLLHCLAF